jgi:hypothetical protein
MGEIISQDVSGRLKRSLGHYTDLTSLTTQLADKASKTEVYPEDYGAKGDGVTDDTAAIQSAIDAAHGTVGTVKFKPVTYLINGTLYIQKDALIGWDINSKVNNPITLIGSNDTKLFGEGTQSTKGSTVLYKPNAGDLIRINLNSNGYKVIQQSGMIFKNFRMENMCLKGVQGVQTTGLKIFSTRVKLEHVSFISLYRGIDANDAEAGGEQNYCDLWHLSDITLTGTGDWGIRVANDDAGIFERITMETHQSTIQGGLYFSFGRGITLSGLLINSLPSTAMAAIYLSAAHNVNINGSHFEYIQSIGIDIESGGEVTIQNCEFFNPSTKSGSAYPQATNHMIKGIGNGIVVSGNTFSLDRASGYDVYLSGVRNQEKNNTYITSAHNYSAERTASFYVINSKGTSFSQPLFIEVKYDTTSSTIKIYSPEGTDITSQFPNVTWNGNGVDFQNCVPINRAMLAVPVQLYNKYRPVLRNTLGLLVYSLNTSNTLVTTPDANIDFMLYLS